MSTTAAPTGIDKHLPAEGVGREYLSNLRENAARTRERQTRARAVSFQMHRLFMPLDEEVSCRLTESGKMVLDIAHLIDRKYVERYQNKFATTSAMMRECQMQLSGPWPPYHFVHRLTRAAHAQPPQHPVSTSLRSSACASSRYAPGLRRARWVSPRIGHQEVSHPLPPATVSSDSVGKCQLWLHLPISFQRCRTRTNQTDGFDRAPVF